MIGLWLEDGQLRLETNLPRPIPPDDEALVRVAQAGICNTDLELIRGYYPYTGVLGHEFVGVVERAPPGFEHLEGQRVVGEINAACGECAPCNAGRHDDKLAMLAELGIDTFPVGPGASIDGEIAAPLRDFDVTIECTGNPEGFDLARRALRPRGTLVLKSTYADRLTLDVSSLVVDEITLVGSRCGPFETALKLLGDGSVYVEELITDRYPLAAGIAALDHARRPGTLKVLLQIS